MPWPSQRRQLTRNRILDSAIELFSNRGYDNVSLGQVMRHAGLTHGAFYAHFRSKQSLYAEAIHAAAGNSALAKMQQRGHDDSGDLLPLLEAYLSEEHALLGKMPCPLAFLATDVTNREEEVRAAYTRVFRRLVALTDRKLPAQRPQRRDRAFALVAMMVGGVALARALNEPRLSKSLLRACRRVGTELVEQAADDSGRD
jgi:TetR/AcrR family transcriptional regulator, transcriptional repressor for nem operon